jgi:hypothetical protein
MKKVIIFLMIVCIFMIDGTAGFTRVKFGDWDKWDEELPSWDNRDWIYSKIKDESSIIITIPPIVGTQFWFTIKGEVKGWRSIKVSSPPSEIEKVENYFVLTRLSFKDNRQRLSTILFSPPPINQETGVFEHAIATAKFALVAFPTEKEDKLVIRSYEKSDGLLKFYKKWTVSFKDKTVVVPKKYKDWFMNQSNKVTRENIGLPQLIVNSEDKQKTFIIGVNFPLIKDFLIEEGLPWINDDAIVLL